MADLALGWNAEFRCADLCLADGDLALDAGLSSIVLASFLTDARADAVALPGDDPDRRGWWGDALETTPWGGLIWTLGRSKATPEVLRRAEDYARAALRWMVTDGIVRAFEISAVRRDGVGDGATLALTIIAIRPDGTREALLFDRLWEATP